jgi:hypothetical protein
MWNFTLTYIRVACPWSDIKKWGSRAVGTYLAMPNGGLGWAAADREVSLAVVAHRLRCAARVLRFQIIWRRRLGFEPLVTGDVYPVAALVRERFHTQLLIHRATARRTVRMNTPGRLAHSALGLKGLPATPSVLRVRSCSGCRPPALLAPLPNLGLAVGLRSSDPAHAGHLGNGHRPFAPCAQEAAGRNWPGTVGKGTGTAVP